MITYVIPIYGAVGLKREQDYVKDPKKTMQSELSDIMEFENFAKTHSQIDLENVQRYTMDSYKTKGNLVSGYLCDPDMAVEQFLLTRQKDILHIKKRPQELDNLKRDIVGYHIIQSFPKYLDISDEEVHQCGRELVEKLGQYQATICSHVRPELKEDGLFHGEQKHNHITINAYCFDPEKQFGKGTRRIKYHDCNETKALLQRYNDEVAIAHGLPIITAPDIDKTHSWEEQEAIKTGNSWKENIRRDINSAMRYADTWDGYINAMKAAGYECKENKYVTYTTPDGQHKVRDKTLGREYTKEVLEKYWSAKKNIDKNINDISDIAADELKQLSDKKTKNDENLYVKISKSNKLFNQKSDTFNIPLNEKIPRKETYTAYFDPQKTYRIFDGNDKPIMRVSGKTLRLYYEQMNERERKQEQPKQKQTQARSYTINGRYFYNSNWKARNNRPYRIGLYDRYGRRRSLIELSLLLAIKIIKEQQNQYTDKRSIPYIRTDWKLQNMLDAVEIASRRNVKTEKDLTEGLNITGKTCRILKSKIKKNDSVYNSLVTLEKTLSEYLSVKDYCENMKGVSMSDKPEKERTEYAEKLATYKRTKEVLYNYHLVSDESIEDLKIRLEYSAKLKEQLSDEYKSASKKYSELKKLQHQLDATHRKEYVFDIEKIQNEQSLLQDEKRM